MNRATLDLLREARRARRVVSLSTDLATGAQALLDRAPGKTGIISTEAGEVFVHVFEPTPRLIIVGAVHTAQKLVPLARLADFRVIVLDPREGFASALRFPDVDLVHLWPDRGMAALRPDSATAVVTLTHDPKLDDPALIAALRSPAFYIGALGSRKTHAGRVRRLHDEGFDDDAVARIHAPVGLPIGAVSPGEIAVSIMAEIVAARHGRVLAATG
jgi:xanthine dehydrogenase accessory factor